MRGSRTWRYLTAAAALCVALADCGDDDDDPETALDAGKHGQPDSGMSLVPKEQCREYLDVCNHGVISKFCVPPDAIADPLQIDTCWDGTCGTVTQPCPSKPESAMDGGSDDAGWDSDAGW
jgi:hypothetical protein